MTQTKQKEKLQTQHPYLSAIHERLLKVEQTQMTVMIEAANLFAKTIMNQGVIHIFGSGHSHIIAEETFCRAGGLVQMNAILDPALMLHISASGSTILERLPGYANIVLDRYSFEPNDLMVVISNSGRNTVPIDAALYAKEKGLAVVALSSVDSYKNTKSRHPSGKLLPEVADIVIDTCSPEGDAICNIEGLHESIGPTSTILGSAVINTIIYEAIKIVLASGKTPPVFVSANIDSDTTLTQSLGIFSRRIKHF
ncbi:MAG: sugar isomerase domain-containing protein [Chloroflexota bacterium]